jgi:predicted RNA-binding protein associated with RNAse of E/G family
MITLIKRNYRGEQKVVYTGEVEARGATWVRVRALFRNPDKDAGYVVFRRNDTFIEWHYSDRWYNVFELHDVDDGHLKGWYCNIARPAVITDDTIVADDLALDVFVSPDGSILLDDEDEFAALDISAEERQQALATVETLRGMVARREDMFAAISD